MPRHIDDRHVDPIIYFGAHNCALFIFYFVSCTRKSFVRRRAQNRLNMTDA